MHVEAATWVAWALRRIEREGLYPTRVLDIGGRNVNGTSRDHFPETPYYVVDIRPGDGVDLVLDASDLALPAYVAHHATYDLVICTEVLEHTPKAEAIVYAAHRCLRPGGALILTTAWLGRAPHSGVDGGALRLTDDRYVRTGLRIDPRRLEWYANIHAADLVRWLEAAPFARYTIDTLDAPAYDIRALAWKGA